MNTHLYLTIYGKYAFHMDFQVKLSHMSGLINFMLGAAEFGPHAMLNQGMLFTVSEFVLLSVF